MYRRRSMYAKKAPAKKAGMGRRRSYRKAAPVKTIAKLSRQIQQVARRDAPELKYVDNNIAINVGATSLVGVGQGYGTAGIFGNVPQGIDKNQRIGNRTKLKYIELRGIAATQTLNTSNGFVDIYFIRYNKSTASTIFVNVLNTQAFLQNDPTFLSITAFSFRDRERYADFTVMGKKRFYMKEDSYNTQQIRKAIYMKINMKDHPMVWDDGTTATFSGRGIYMLAVSSVGDTTSTTGYSLSMEARTVYTDA